MAVLSDWDGDLGAGSGQAALFEIWFSKHLGPLAARMEGATPEVASLLVPFDPPSIASWLEKAALTARHAGLVRQSLSDAWAECASLMGADPSNWSWGHIHKLKLVHPLQSFTDEEWSLPPIALGGSSSTLNYANYRLADFSVVAGPSVRMVIDVGDWDNSLFINNPGQSGVPGSPHYQDLFANWHDGSHCPMVYSQKAIEAATVRTIILKA